MQFSAFRDKAGKLSISQMRLPTEPLELKKYIVVVWPKGGGAGAADWGKTAWKGGGSSSAEGAGMKGEDSVASAGPAPDKDGRSRSPHRRKDGDSDAVAQSATIASDALMERIKALGVRNGVNVKKYIYCCCFRNGVNV